MHADKREEIDSAEAGDIVAVMGIDAASGDTYAAETKFCTLESMFVPEPVIKMAIAPVSRDGADRLSKALHRFRREDPTFRVTTDEETGETIIAGMGELHLEIYVERIRREYKVEVEVGAPKVNYREAPTAKAEFNYRHKKQTGGSGQFAHIVGHLEPLARGRRRDIRVRGARSFGGRIPKEFIPAVEKGFRAVGGQGPDRRAIRSSASRRCSKTARITRSTARTWRSRRAPAIASARRSCKPSRCCLNR